MASYNYPPPPPPPSQAQPPSGYSNYGQPYQQAVPSRGSGGPSRRGSGHYQPPRPDYHNAAPPPPAHTPYAYPPAPQGYAPQPPPAQYAPQPPPAANYPPPVWHHEHAHQAPQPAPAPAPLSAENYHPNYARHIYAQPAPQPPQAQPPYGQPAPYQAPPPPQPTYADHQYRGRPPHGGHPPQQWGSQQAQPPPPQQHASPRGGRGGHHAHHGDRSGSKLMGPPIRIGFSSENQHPHPAQASAVYPPPYSGPHAPPAQYPSPQYPAFSATPQPPIHAQPVPFDQYYSPNVRRGGHGNFAGNMRGRPHMHGDKMHNRKQGGGNSNWHQKPDADVLAKKKKRKTNTLGLTPGDDSDSDYEDEEVKLVELLGNEAVNPPDLASWIEQRKQNYPTRARIEAKKAAEAKPQLSKLEKQERKAEKLRQELAMVESSIKRKREQQDEGDEMRDTSDSQSDGDDKPEVKSSKASGPHIPTSTNAAATTTTTSSGVELPPPPTKADPSKHCKYYSTGGTCGKKGKCRFVHDEEQRRKALEERALNGGRMTLQQRLILNDKNQEDLTILKSVLELQSAGKVERPALAASENNASASATATPATTLHPPPVETAKPARPQTHSLPNIPAGSQVALPSHAPPPSMNGQAHTVRYQGWNLGGYGNNGVKQEDLK